MYQGERCVNKLFQDLLGFWYFSIRTWFVSPTGSSKTQKGGDEEGTLQDQYKLVTRNPIWIIKLAVNNYPKVKMLIITLRCIKHTCRALNSKLDKIKIPYHPNISNHLPNLKLPAKMLGQEALKSYHFFRVLCSGCIFVLNSFIKW